MSAIWRFFNLEWGRFSPFFLSIHPLFRFNFSLLISIRNIVSPDEIQKQGLGRSPQEKGCGLHQRGMLGSLYDLAIWNWK